MAVLTNTMMQGTSAFEEDTGLYKIEKSLKFNSADTTYLNKTPSNIGNRSTWTWAGWVKKSTINENVALFTADDGGSDFASLIFVSDTFRLDVQGDGMGRIQVHTSPDHFTDAGAWMHCVCVLDTNNTIADDRCRMYVNGLRRTTTATITQSKRFAINKTVGHEIGRRSDGDDFKLNGYLADVHFIDGLALSPAAFGSFDSLGVWNPKAFAIPNPNDGRTWSSNAANLTNPANAFDGDTVAGGSKADSGASQVSITFDPPLTNVVEFEHNSHNGGVHVWAFNGGELVEDEGGSASLENWRKPPSEMKLPSTINSFQVRYGPADTNANVSLAGIRVNGVVLVNGLTDPTTRTNPNNVTTWNSATSGGSVHGSYPMTQSFDGLINTTGVRAVSGGGFVFQPSSAIAYSSKIEVHSGASGTGTQQCEINDGTAVNVAENRWVTVKTGSGTLTKLEMTAGSTGNANIYLGAVRIDGHILIDAADDNSYHLKFNDGTSEATVGKDSFNNGTWTNNSLQNNLSSNPEMKYFKFRSTYNSTGYSCAYSVEYSDNDSSWTEAWNGIASTAGGACQLIQGTNGGGSYGTHRYWRFKCGATNNSTAFPRVSRLVLVDSNNVEYLLARFVDDNCSDSGTIPTNGDTYSRDFREGGDITTDTPTNYGTDTGIGGEVRGNYATWNPLHESNPGKMQASNGNLTSKQAANWGGGLMATMGAKTGKWYYELLAVDETDSRPVFGIVPAQYGAQLPGEGGANSVGYRGTGVKRINTSGGNEQAYGDAWVDGDIIGVALDCDNGAVYFSRNGTWQASGVPTSGASRTNACHTWTGASEYMIPAIAEEGASTSIINFGQRAFKYTAPSGYKCLCSTNLDDTFTGNDINNPSKFFDAKLYEGTGSAISVDQINFSPDLLWIKSRDDANHNWMVYDRIRGNNYMMLNLTDGDNSTGTLNTSLDSDGYTISTNSNYNTNDDDYVSYVWDAGSAASGANNDGSINISNGNQWKNATAGFSITKYTATASSGATVGHGLNAVPEFIIIKNMDANSTAWGVYHVSLGPPATADEGLVLNEQHDTTQASTSDWWASTNPTNTVFSLGNKDTVNPGSSNNCIAYCWTPIAGYSSFGKYIGNGESSNGPYVNVGFKPRFLLLKANINGEDWIVIDSARTPFNHGSPNTLFTNDSSAEQDTGTYDVDLYSNGFKIKNNNPRFNTDTKTYIYAAFAEHPQKITRAI